MRTSMSLIFGTTTGNSYTVRIPNALDTTNTDILMATTTATIILGFVTWTFKQWKEYVNLKTGMAYRQDDIVMIFRCLRILLETATHTGRNENNPENLDTTLKELNRHMEKRAAGLKNIQ